MKKLNIILLFLFAACNNKINSDKPVVTEIDLVNQEESTTCKYKVYIKSVRDDFDPYFYTNQQFKVGDTVYFSINPQPCQ
jgi:hypothetical protein